MDIGIIGSGPLGIGWGEIWACQGHRICLSYSRQPAKLTALARSIGSSARAGTPLEAAQFGTVVLLAVPWNLTAAVLAQVHPALDGKTLLSCVVPWNADRSGLMLGTTTSAAEQIAVLSGRAQVVEALPLLAEALPVSAHRFGSRLPTLFYCGDHMGAKARVVELLEGAEMDLIDAGPLWSARFLEPMAALLWHLGVGLGAGTDLAVKLLRRNAEKDRG